MEMFGIDSTKLWMAGVILFGFVFFMIAARHANHGATGEGED